MRREERNELDEKSKELIETAVLKKLNNDVPELESGLDTTTAVVLTFLVQLFSKIDSAENLL